MKMKTIIIDSIVNVINKLPDSILSIATRQTGIEEIIYPHFNIELIRHFCLDEIDCIGYGRLPTDTSLKCRFDCILITKPEGRKIAIEIKGPSQTAFLLAGASGTYNEDIDGVLDCLKNAYNKKGNTADIHPDSQIGDTIKLIKLIKEGELHCAFSIGILKYTSSTVNEKNKYLQKLQKMLICLKEIEFISLNHSFRDIDDKFVLISVIEISQNTSSSQEAKK